MQIPLCEHTKTDGNKCQAAALRDNKYCYYHDRYHRDQLPNGHTSYEAPVFEDSRSILLGIHHAITSMLSGNLDTKLAGLALYGYQVASSVVNREDARSPLEEEQLKAQALALEELKLKAKIKLSKDPAAKKEEKKDSEEEGPSLMQMFFNTLQEMKRGEWRPAHLDEDECDLPVLSAPPDPKDQPK